MDEKEEDKIKDIKLKNSKKVLNPNKQYNTQFVQVNKENEIDSEIFTKSQNKKFFNRKKF